MSQGKGNAMSHSYLTVRSVTVGALALGKKCTQEALRRKRQEEAGPG